MNRYLFMGLFALVVVLVSLWRVLAEKDLQYFYCLKRAWGRTLGLGLHFVTHVGLPLVAGVVFLSKGIVSFDPGTSVESFVPAVPQVQILISESAEARLAVLAASPYDRFLTRFELLMP